MWVGIDDTDSLEGGCTTYVVVELIKEMPYDLIGFPRLVRLNPNIPWKTRGNGAVALRVGIGKGEKFEIGRINNKKIYCYSSIKKDVNPKEIFKIVKKVLIENSMEEADPSFVISKKKLPYWIYKKGVRGILKREEVENELRNAIYYYYKKGRGILGASAAIAWKPKDRTYELITYTYEKKWIDKESVIKMDKICKSTFNNYDYENDYIAIFPKANSPVFFGIRGDDWVELKKAMKLIKSSPYNKWIIFETNQATDEHLQRKKKIKDIRPYESVIVKGVVKKEPRNIKGGHVIFSIYDGNEIDCAAYEPTKQFRNIIRQLKQGDKVIVYGGVRKKPFTINLEKIEIKKLIDVYEKIENPICKNCKKHMKSMGKGKGYRCPKCGARAKKAKYAKIERKIKEGLYEVPIIAMRHLAKPIKRMKENCLP